jgi:hypothetical protein
MSRGQRNGPPLPFVTPHGPLFGCFTHNYNNLFSNITRYCGSFSLDKFLTTFSSIPKMEATNASEKIILFTILYGFTAHKTEIFVVTAERTSSLSDIAIFLSCR